VYFTYICVCIYLSVRVFIDIRPDQTSGVYNWIFVHVVLLIIFRLLFLKKKGFLVLRLQGLEQVLISLGENMFLIC
jgi:hypothetical protein